MYSKAQLDGNCGARRRVRLAVVACCACLLIGSEYMRGQGQAEPSGTAPVRSGSRGEDSQAARELKLGSSLTREGKLQEAIPHLLSARSAGASAYATGINLGICYIGTGRYSEAIAELEVLRTGETATAAVHNLLAQAYLGDGQVGRAWDSFLAASALTPNDEKLYAYMADACTDQHRFEMGLRAMDVGIGHISDSARLHYERGLFLAQLGRLDEAGPEWERAAQLAPGSYIATLSLVQRDLYDGRISEATQRVLAMVSAGNGRLPLCRFSEPCCCTRAPHPAIRASFRRRQCLKKRPAAIRSFPPLRLRWAGSTFWKSVIATRSSTWKWGGGWSPVIRPCTPISRVLIII